MTDEPFARNKSLFVLFCPVKRQSTGHFVFFGSFVRLNANPPDKSSLPNVTRAARHLKTTKKSESGTI